MEIHEDNLSPSTMFGHGENLSIVTTDQQHIPCKDKGNKTSDSLIMRKYTIQEPVNPRKRAK